MLTQNSIETRSTWQKQTEKFLFLHNTWVFFFLVPLHKICMKLVSSFCSVSCVVWPSPFTDVHTWVGQSIDLSLLPVKLVSILGLIGQRERLGSLLFLCGVSWSASLDCLDLFPRLSDHEEAASFTDIGFEIDLEFIRSGFFCISPVCMDTFVRCNFSCLVKAAWCASVCIKPCSSHHAISEGCVLLIKKSISIRRTAWTCCDCDLDSKGEECNRQHLMKPHYSSNAMGKQQPLLPWKD